MIQSQDKKKCCGCTACLNICPKSAINMVMDKEGFLYPSVNMSLCINCNMCEKVCPVGKNMDLPKPIEAIVAQYYDDTIRYNSTSGAAVNAIAEYILSLGGSVFGAALSNKVECEHIRVDEEKELKRIQGSKYVQSDLKKSFCFIKELLKQDKYVLFVGTPCQVAGLKSYLEQNYEKLYTIDLACHGVPSPGLFQSYVDYLSKKHKSNVVNVVFRDKTYGYLSSNVKVYFENGKTRDCRSDVKTFTHMMFNGLSLRPSCYDCFFKTKGRISDLTLFDCAMVKLYAPQMDDDKGTTSILIQSKKGKDILSNPNVIKKIKYFQVDPDELISTEGTMIINSATMNSKRAVFFEDFEIMSYESLCKKWIPRSLKMIVGNVVKKTLWITGPVGKKMIMFNKSQSIKQYKNRYNK